MNFAYVITAHKNALQLTRLLHALDAPGNTYVLHVDAKADRSVHDAAADFAANHPNSAVIPSEKIVWGSWRLARAQIRGVRRALELCNRWQYCMNLTAQDYPLRTQNEIAAELSAGPEGANYIDVLDFDKASPGPRRRLEWYWLPLRGKMRRTVRRRPLPFHVYWGANYFAFTRAACEFVSTSDLSRQMQRAFRFALCSDELIFQNTLMHGPLRDTIVSRSLRKVTWGGGMHPKIYTCADRDELLIADAWFARKFDETVDSRILDELDTRLHVMPASSPPSVPRCVA